MIGFLQKNFQKKYVLDDLCNYIGLSRSACCRYFKKMMNMSIFEYILEYRLSQALFLLNNTNRSITEIALQTGFSTTSYFISIFKKKMSLTPFEYKAAMKRNPTEKQEKTGQSSQIIAQAFQMGDVEESR